MEDFIIILLGIIITIFSAYQKNKKKKVMQSESNDTLASADETVPASNPKTQQNWLDELLADEPEEQHTAIPYQSVDAKDADATYELKQQETRNDIQIKNNQYEPKTDDVTKKPKPTKTKRKATHNFRRNRSFDLRRAVVYSEIINRKY